jgi:hypothetical protein
MNIEALLASLKHLEPVNVLSALFPIVIVGSYYVGRASVDISPETVCAPVAKDLKRATMQIATLEGVVIEQRTECATECHQREQLICVEKLATQLARIKQLRCDICNKGKEGVVLP